MLNVTPFCSIQNPLEDFLSMVCIGWNPDPFEVNSSVVLHPELECYTVFSLLGFEWLLKAGAIYSSGHIRRNLNSYRSLQLTQRDTPAAALLHRQSHHQAVIAKDTSVKASWFKVSAMRAETSIKTCEVGETWAKFLFKTVSFKDQLKLFFFSCTEI